MLGALLMGFSKTAGSFEMIVIGRLSTGVACGFFTALSPLYVSEIAPVKIRGQLGTVNQERASSLTHYLSPKSNIGKNFFLSILATLGTKLLARKIINLDYNFQRPSMMSLKLGWVVQFLSTQ